MSQTSILDGLLTPQELADDLDCTRRTIDRWHRLGIGPPRITIGRTPYYARDSVIAWLQSREQKV
jgi:DNA-binding transcriptional MerR regulator